MQQTQPLKVGRLSEFKISLELQHLQDSLEVNIEDWLPGRMKNLLGTIGKRRI